MFEAEVKDKLEEAKETVSHKVAEVSQMAHSMAQFLTDAEVEQLLGEFSMDTLLGPSSRGGKPRLSKGLFHSLVRFGKSAGGCISSIGGLGQGTSDGL